MASQAVSHLLMFLFEKNRNNQYTVTFLDFICRYIQGTVTNSLLQLSSDN